MRVMLIHITTLTEMTISIESSLKRQSSSSAVQKPEYLPLAAILLQRIPGGSATTGNGPMENAWNRCTGLARGECNVYLF